ncbi:MAG: EutN/CcmL family microcompartment protein [Planctomycetota bacterium]|jgi:ethanolamine utilization protein EutN
MQIGHVIGSATATVKHPSLTGWKLLIVQFVGVTGADDGEPVIVFDMLGAGAGDRVIASSDGAAMQAMMKTKATPARWFVAGIVDS